jgi:hypothetical protein
MRGEKTKGMLARARVSANPHHASNHFATEDEVQHKVGVVN